MKKVVLTVVTVFVLVLTMASCIDTANSDDAVFEDVTNLEINDQNSGDKDEEVDKG